MGKKKYTDDEDFEQDDDSLNEEELIQDNKTEEETETDPFDSEIEVSDDDDNIDIIIEIDEDDLSFSSPVEEEKPEGTEDEIVLSKHKIEGKHSLKYDSIFKGKKEDPLNEEEFDGGIFHKDSIEVDKSSNYYFESIDNENYTRSKLVKERVYEVLLNNTSLNFLNNRRKPSRTDFNDYYNLLKLNLKEESFTNIELFNELSVYFSDNLFNMFKLLDNKWRNLIISELQDHIGKNKNSKEIINRNIYTGTEIEFYWIDEFGENKLITGVVVETDYENSEFKVDSYENIYEVSIKSINKILNNEKFKYNLNKLNNIDFL
jgi:hypothetical protein